MSREAVLSRASRMPLLAALLMVVLTALAAPALATEAEGGAAEEEGAAPSIEEIGTQNDVSKEWLPEETELPPFQRFLYVPLVLGGLFITGVLLFMYLTWQPRFAEERRSKRRR